MTTNCIKFTSADIETATGVGSISTLTFDLDITVEPVGGLFEELLDRLPCRHEASEQLVRLLGWFKELQERVEAAYLKTT